MADQIKVRFANQTDLDGCIALDHATMSAEIIKRKVEQREIIVAEKTSASLRAEPQAEGSVEPSMQPLVTAAAAVRPCR